MAATLELGLLDQLAEPDRCRCRALLRPRPPEYARALARAVRTRRLGLSPPSSGTVQEVDFYRRVPRT